MGGSSLGYKRNPELFATIGFSDQLAGRRVHSLIADAGWRVINHSDMSRLFARILGFEVLVLFLVGAIFKLLAVRLFAGIVAGGVFVLLGLGIMISCYRAGRMRSMSFWLSSIHLFMIALPMMTVRLLNISFSWSDLRVLGLSAPDFHRLSTGFYLIMIAGTAYDLYNARRLEKRRESKPNKFYL